MKKALFVIVLLCIVAGIIAFLWNGVGFGTSGDSTGELALPSVSEPVETAPETAEETVSIEVKEDGYFVNGVKTSITKIEAMLLDGVDTACRYIVEDNYGSIKAWDTLKGLFVEYGIGYAEQESNA